MLGSGTKCLLPSFLVTLQGTKPHGHGSNLIFKSQQLVSQLKPQSPQAAKSSDVSLSLAH